jgi:WD40 repeat protein
MIVIQPHTDCVNVVCFTRDGSRLASVAEDGWVKVWTPGELHTGKPLWELDGEAADDPKGGYSFGSYGLSDAKFSADGQTLFTTGWKRHLRAWDVKTGEPKWEFLKPSGFGGIGTLAIARDGSQLAFSGGQIGSPDRVYVLDVKTHKNLKTFNGHTDACGALAAGPDGLASGSADKHVKFWDWSTGECYHDLALRGIVRGLVFSPDGSRFAAAGGAVVMVWDMIGPDGKGKRKPTKLKRFRGHTDQIQCLDFSPDGQTIASAAHDGTVRVWDAATGTEIRAYAPKVGQLHHVAFAPDGLTLAFSSEKGHLGILDLDG